MTTSNDRSPQSSTKEKILYAAFILFAENGFEGTSTRKICEMAETNVSAVNYYFQSKENLYNVVIERIAERFRSNMSEFFDLMNSIPSMDHDKARSIIIQFVTQFMNLVLFYNLPVHIALIMSREHIAPGKAYEILFKNVFKDSYKLVYELLKIIAQNKYDENQLILNVNAILGVVLGFRAFKSTTIRFLDVGEYDTTQENIVKQIILDQVNFILDKAGGKL